MSRPPCIKRVMMTRIKMNRNSVCPTTKSIYQGILCINWQKNASKDDGPTCNLSAKGFSLCHCLHHQWLLTIIITINSYFLLIIKIILLLLIHALICACWGTFCKNMLYCRCCSCFVCASAPGQCAQHFLWNSFLLYYIFDDGLSLKNRHTRLTKHIHWQSKREREDRIMSIMGEGAHMCA